MPAKPRTKTKVAEGKQKGQFRKSIGKERLITGDLKPKRFFLGHDREVAIQKAYRIEAEWATLLAAGHLWWTDEALSKLRADNIVPEQSLTGRNAAKMIGEPLNAVELKPFIDEQTGLIRPEVAPQAIDYGARKLFTRLDVRSRLFDQLYADAKRDPIATLERCVRIFGWNAKEAAQFLFNVSGSMAVNPMGFDATAPQEEKRQNLVDAGILKADADESGAS